MVEAVEGVGVDDGGPEEDVGVGGEAEEGEGEVRPAGGRVRFLELEVDDGVEVMAGADCGGVELGDVAERITGAVDERGERLGEERRRRRWRWRPPAARGMGGYGGGAGGDSGGGGHELWFWLRVASEQATMFSNRPGFNIHDDYSFVTTFFLLQ